VKRPHLDRTTAIGLVIGVLFVAAYAATVALANRYYVISAPASSVYSSSATGFKVYYSYLQELGVSAKVQQSWETLPEDATLICAGPFQQPATKEEAEALGRWVRKGGRLVAVGPDAQQLTRPMGFGGSPSAGEASETLKPLFPGAYARGIAGIQPGADRLLVDDSAWVAHFKDYAGQVLVTQKVGEGEVAWLAGAWPLTNAGIGGADNGRFAVTLATAGGRPVYFDEYHHGYVHESGYWDRLSAGGRSSVVLLALALAVALAGWGRRVAPVIVPPAPHTARGGAYISQLAELYRKAGARADALVALEDGLSRALARTHGAFDAGLAHHPAAAEALADSRALRERSSIPADAFLATARRLSRARQEVEGHDG
jgi:CRP-like cAMP-binding protein